MSVTFPAPHRIGPAGRVLDDEHATSSNDEILARYFASKRTQWRPKTVQVRRYQLFRLAELLHPTPLVEATEEDLLAWHDTLDGGAESIKGYVSAAHGFYQWLALRARPRIRLDDPSAILELPKIPQRQPRPMLERQYELALACGLSDPTIYAWLGLMGCSGLRCCEVAWLRSIDVEERRDGTGLLHVEGKGGKQRTVPAGQYLMATLRPFVDANPGGAVFLRDTATRYAHRPYTPDAVSAKLNTFLRGIGIASTAHTLRHRFGTDYHAIDADMYRQAKLMGHSSVETTAIYTALDPAEAARYVDKLTQRRMAGIPDGGRGHRAPGGLRQQQARGAK